MPSLWEAQTIAALNNPHIIHIHDIFEENGTAYYVMDYLSGGSLSDLVQRDGVLAEATALGYIRQVADALSYIHARNINHLDIKPSNVLIDGNGNAVVIAFGLSKRYDETGSQTSTTRGRQSWLCAPRTVSAWRREHLLAHHRHLFAGGYAV